MNRTTIASTWLGIFASIAIVFGTIAHADKTDPAGHVSTASIAVHGVVIPPFNR